MRTLLQTVIGIFVIVGSSWADTKNEDLYISLIHKLQFIEKFEDLKALIPYCPPPKPDAGEDNTEVIIKAKLFGFDARGEFNFHKNVLVSHGFTIETPTYKDAHRVFLEAARILDKQVDGIHVGASLPFGLDDEDGSDGPEDELDLFIRGEHQRVSFGLGLHLRSESVTVGWGAQKIALEQKAK